MPSTRRAKRLPKDRGLTFAGVSVVSWEFWPVRAASLCHVRTPGNAALNDADDVCADGVMLEPLQPVDTTTAATARVTRNKDRIGHLADCVPCVPARAFSPCDLRGGRKGSPALERKGSNRRVGP